MLTCQVGKSIVDTFTYKEEQLRKWSNKGMLKCPACGEKMLYCHGDFKIAYFRHEKNSDCPDIYSEGVTQEHIQGIKIIYDWLQSQECIDNLQLEKWIPETRQRPDIYFTRNGQEYAIEFQCSPIATQYNKRHDLYRLQGIKDIWILGLDKYSINNFDELDLSSTIKLKAIETENYDTNGKILYLNTATTEILSISKLYNLWRDKTYKYQVIMKTTYQIDLNTYNLKDIKIKQLASYIEKSEDIIDLIKYKVNYLNNLCKSKRYTICRSSDCKSWLGIFEDYDGYSQLIDEFNSNSYSIDDINNSKKIQREIDNIELENFIKESKSNKDTKKLIDKINNYVKNIDNLYEIKFNYNSYNIYYELRFNGFRLFDKNILEDYKKGLNELEKIIKKDLDERFNNIELLINRDEKIEYINKLSNNIKMVKPIGKYQYRSSLYIRDSDEENIKIILNSYKNNIINIFNNYIICDDIEIKYNETNFFKTLEKLITDKIRNERYGR
jgi:competence CoiA-like predicted nuclease